MVAVDGMDNDDLQVLVPGRIWSVQAPFMAAHPAARGHLAPGLRGKRPDLAGWPDLPAQFDPAGDARFGDRLRGWFLPGMPTLNETAWFDGLTATLVLTDLLFCLGAGTAGAGKGVLERQLARLLGVDGRLAMTPTMQRLVRDRGQLAAAVATLRGLPVERVVVAHDSVITDRADAAWRDALAWLA